jgi:rhodanese-related sulfurtransferase
MLFIQKPEDVAPEDVVAAVGQSNVGLVDLRGADLRAEVHRAGSCQLPLEELSGRLGELAAGLPVAFVCRSGGRGFSAARAAAKHGGDALNLGGGMLVRGKAGLSIERTSQLAREHAGQRR